MYYYQEHGILLPSELEELLNAALPDPAPPENALATAIGHADYSITVRNAESRLIGFLLALDDGAIHADLPLILVHPDYRRGGIATELLRLTREHYRDYRRIRLIASPENAYFYQHQGFVIRSSEIPMECSAR